MPVPILVDEIFCRYLTDRSEPLWAPWSHPDKVACSDWIPRVIESIDATTFQHQETMLHHMHFDHAQRRARLVLHRIDRKIETHLIRKQALDLQIGIIFQRMGVDSLFARHDWPRRPN